MCLTEIGVVVAVDGALASVVVGQRQATVSVAPLVLDGHEVRPGDRVVLQLGLAVDFDTEGSSA